MLLVIIVQEYTGFFYSCGSTALSDAPIFSLVHVNPTKLLRIHEVEHTIRVVAVLVAAFCIHNKPLLAPVSDAVVLTNKAKVVGVRLNTLSFSTDRCCVKHHCAMHVRLAAHAYDSLLWLHHACTAVSCGLLYIQFKTPSTQTMSQHNDLFPQDWADIL